MGASIGPQGNGGKRSLDAEVNLVPFIDLLSMCICFLLMTAVWIQVGSLQVKQSRGTEAAATTGPIELELKFLSASAIDISVKRDGRGIKKRRVESSDTESVLKRVDDGLDALIVSALGKSVNGSLVAPGSQVASAMITPAKNVAYGDLVGALDVLRKHKIINLGVVPVDGRL